MSENKPRKRLFTRTGDRVALVFVIVLIALTLIFNGLNAAGLRLVEGSLYFFLPLILALVLLGWGFSAILRRIQKPVPKRVATVVVVFIMLSLAVLGVQMGTFAAGFTYPAYYATMTGPNTGHQIIVMRGVDSDPERIKARREARTAADPENTEMSIDDWGYVYTAYASGPLGLFYKTDTLLEGEVHIGYASKGELMMEWDDEETTAYFFIKNPEPYDDGTMRTRAV